MEFIQRDRKGLLYIKRVYAKALIIGAHLPRFSPQLKKSAVLTNKERYSTYAKHLSSGRKKIPKR